MCVDDVCDTARIDLGTRVRPELLCVPSTLASGRRHGDMRVYGDRQRMILPVRRLCDLLRRAEHQPRRRPVAAFLWLRNRFTRDTHGARHPLHCVCVVLHGGAGNMRPGGRACGRSTRRWSGSGWRERVSFLTATGNVK